MLPQTGRKSCNKNKIAELVKQCPQNPRQVSKELLLSPAAARPARTHGHAHTTGTDGDSHSRGHRLKAKGDKVWQEEDVASLTWPAGRGSGEEGLWKEWGLSWGAGKAGQAGKSKEGKEGCMPHRHAQSGSATPAHPGKVPTIQPRAHSTSQPPPGAAVAIQVARRERREDAQHWGVPIPAKFPSSGLLCLPALSPTKTQGPHFF